MGGVKHTVIVPAYNTGEAIGRCIDSILAQSIGDWELIVVDDGSSDCTPEVIDEYAGKDERIRAIHIANGGVSNARNVGLEAARGEYVMFVDSDDWLEPDYLREVESHMGDDADASPLIWQAFETGHDHVQQIIIQTSEAFIQEEKFQRCGAVQLDNRGQSQCQGE